MKKTLLLLAFLYGSLQMLYSQNQEDGVVSFKLPVRNSMKFNKFLLNPTFSFVKEQGAALSFYNKRQWVQFDQAPQTYLFSYSGRFKENEGISLGLFQQNYGVLTTFGGVANFAHNVVLQQDSNLTFGLNLGFYKSGLNKGAVVSNTIDPSLENIPSNSLLTINPGINYGVGNLDFGVSMNNLFLYNVNSSKMVENDPEKSIQAHIMHTGYLNTYGFFDKSKFSALVSSEFKKEKTVISGLMMFAIPTGIWIQAGYNTLYGASGGLGLNLTPRISIEYNFEKSLGDLSNFGSSHEIVLAYKFKRKNIYYGEDEEEGAIIPVTVKKYVPTKPNQSAVSPPINSDKLKDQKAADSKADALAQIQKAKEAADAKSKSDALAQTQKAKEAADSKAKAVSLAQTQQAKEAADAKSKVDALAQQAKEAADAKAKADALAQALKAKETADAKAKANALTQQAKEAADAKSKADALAQAQKVADAKAKADALAQQAKEAADAKAKTDELAQTQKAKEAADAKAKADALAQAQKAKEAADTKAKTDALAQTQKAKEAADAKAKADALAQQAKEAADAKSKVDALAQQAKEAADAKAKADAVAQAQKVADAKAKAYALAQQAKEAADAKSKADALAQAQKVADAKAKADALAQQAKEVADAKAKTDALAQAQKVADVKAKADALAQQAKQADDAKAKGDALAQVQKAADAKTKAAAEEKLATVTNDENAKSMDDLAKVLDQSKNRQKQLLGQLETTVSNKEKELKELKDENDLSEKGIFKEPKPFKSITEENKAIEALKQQIIEENEQQNKKIKDLDNLYKERLTKVPSTNDAINQNYKNTIEQLKSEQSKVISSNKELISSLEKIKVDTEIERKRRIKRAAFVNADDKYTQDVATLKRIKETTSLSTTPLKPADFDFGAEQLNTQILKNINNVEKGYYLVIAVHNDVAKRDAFLTKVVSAGQTDVNFLYDVNSSNYYIYYDKFKNFEEAQKALSNKGDKPYNGKMAVVKVE